MLFNDLFVCDSNIVQLVSFEDIVQYSMLCFDHLTLAAFIHSLAVRLLHTAYVPQMKEMRSIRHRV